MPEIKYAPANGDAGNWRDLKWLRALDFEPDTKYAYNTDTFLRRLIIEKIGGKSCNDFVQHDMVKKNGIKNEIVDPAEKEPLIARSFDTAWICSTANGFP